MTRTAPEADSAWDGSAALRRLVAAHAVPVLAARGYTGRTRTFKVRRDRVTGEIATQLSVHNTSLKKEFTFNLRVMRDGEVVWTDRIGTVSPAMRDLWWTLASESDIQPVGQTVAEHLDRYACVAIEEVMSDPHPGRIPEDARRFATPPNDGPSVPLEQFWEFELWRREVVQNAKTWGHEEALRNAWSSDDLLRLVARRQLWERWPDDPQTVLPLVDSLEHDPSPEVRETAAREIGFLPPRMVDRLALQGAADLDEDHRVRWAARFAMRMADHADRAIT